MVQQGRLPVDGLQVRLFGELSIQHKGRSLPPLTGKALELFCYLLLYRDRAHTREILSEVLWPGGKSPASRRYLRQALWRLSTAMQYLPDSHGKDPELLVISDHGWVRINPDGLWWLDVSEFERAYATTRDTAGHNLSEHQAHELEVALDLYRGDLLPAWYQDWCSYERDRLQLVYLAMLDQLMGYCEARRLYAKGLGFGQAVLRYDPTRECTHRQLMRLYYRAGDRTSAIRQYERCASVMAREFGIQPSADTVALYEQIRADRVPDIPPLLSAASPMVQQPVPGQREFTVLTDLRVRLDQIQASLYLLQESVMQGRGGLFGHVGTAQNGSSEKANGLLE
jgi:DNA-binding SARP family transcriptional activator